MPALALDCAWPAEPMSAGAALTYDYDTKGERTGITSLLGDLMR